MAEGCLHFSIEGCSGGIGGWVTGVYQGGIELFDDEPVPRLQSGDHPLERQLVCWHVDEHQASVDQIKGLCGQWIGANVVALDLNGSVGKRGTLHEKAWVDIGDQHLAGLPAALC